MSKFYPEPYEPFSRDINVTVDLSNYARKADRKNISHVDASNFARKTNLANFKNQVDKLDNSKLVPVPTALSKLRDVVKNDVVKKDVYDKLVAKVNNIDTNNFVLKTKNNTDKTELETKIPSVADFVKEEKLIELQNKILDIGNLATKTALTTVENKIPDVNNLFSKTDYNTKVTEIGKNVNNHNHDKYIDTSELNKFTSDGFNARLAPENSITKRSLILSCRILTEKVLKIKQIIYLLKMN